MENREGIVLHLLLQDADLDGYARLKEKFFTKDHRSVYNLITKYYNKKGNVPTFDQLLLFCDREINSREAVTSIKEIEVPESIYLDLAIDALIEEYIGSAALDELAVFIPKIPSAEPQEIIDGLVKVALDLDSRLSTDERIISVNQLKAFKNTEITEQARTGSGIGNPFQEKVGGFFLEDLILIGGHRGAGKSLVCANIAISQYEQGNVVPYFTIEMSAQETYDRMLAIMSKVPFKHIKENHLTQEDERALAEVRTRMFEGGSDVLQDYLIHRDVDQLERDLEGKAVIKNPQIIIVDDSELSMATIDITVQKLKTEYGDKMKVVVIDYLNQIQMGDEQFDWKEQIQISKHLKNIARKYEVAIVSPYQIDEKGTVRFSKGILDSCDVAMNLKRSENCLEFECQKARSAENNFSYRLPVHWDHLELDQVAVIPDESEPPWEEEESGTRHSKAIGASDL